MCQDSTERALCNRRPPSSEAGAYGEEGSRRSVADVTDAKSLGEVRAFKKAAKAAAKG